jgi:predicted hotdog family 3-hydroxylacyl-ACP dehydratase
MDPVVDILELLPQAPPFVMIGELLFADGSGARSAFVVPTGNPLVVDGAFTEAGLLENMAQTVAAGAGYRAKQANLPVGAGYIAAVKQLEIARLPKIAERIVTEARLREELGNLIVVEASITLGDTVTARCEMNIFAGSQS